MADEDIETGLSDDFSTYTIVKDDGKLENIEDEGESGKGEGEGEGEGEETFFDLEEVLKNVPEDQHKGVSEAYEKMQTAFKTKMSGIANMQQQAGLVNALVEKLKAVPSQTQVQPEIKPKVDEEGKGLKFKFEDKDYYEPVFKEMVGLISGLQKSIDSMQTGYEVDRKVDFQTGVKNFFSQNKTELVPNIIQKMDEIAMEYGKDAKGNFVMYQNLPRLLKMAKTDLGIKDKTTPINTKKSKVGVKRQIESQSRKKVSTQEKPAQSMREAWDQAEEQLSQQE